MTFIKVKTPPAPRGEALRQRVIAAAERLLRLEKIDFSMRDLAAEAGVSFATPFNQFGSKAAIMLALSGLRIDKMEADYIAARPAGDAHDRILVAVEMAAAVMVQEPLVNRAVMGWLGTAGPNPGNVWARSTALWALALGEGDGLIAVRREQALRCLPGHLALTFRGVLSFWTAGEIQDEALSRMAREIAGTLLLGFVDQQARPNLGP